jgi:hypothetical protein
MALSAIPVNSVTIEINQMSTALEQHKNVYTILKGASTTLNTIVFGNF